MSHVVLAPDKFKGTLTAAQAAARLAAGLEQARPGLRTVRLPVADGGDGTVAARMSSPTPRLEAVSGAGTPPGSRPSPAACADSMTAVPPPNANSALTSSPAGPWTSATARR